MNLRFIVTGVNRSGTVFTARLLTSLGVPCGHESIFNDKGPSFAKTSLMNPKKRIMSFSSTHETFNNHADIPFWLDTNVTVAESSYLAVPFLDWELIEKVPIIHIVRDPLKVVSSLIGDVCFFSRNTVKSNWEQPIHDLFPEINENISNQIERACYYYIQWNSLIEEQKTKRPYFFSRVEDLPNCEFFEFTNTIPNKKMFKNRTINHFGRKTDLILSEIPKGKIKSDFIEMIEKYGYSKTPKRIKIL